MTNAQMQQDEPVRIEEYEVCGDVALVELRELLGRSDVRRIMLKNQAGETILEVPILQAASGGPSSALLVPIWAAIGAVAALSPQLRVCVQRLGTPDEHVRAAAGSSTPH